MNIKKNPSSSEINNIKIHGNLKTALMIIGGISGLVFGGQLIVDNAIIIARSFDVS